MQKRKSVFIASLLLLCVKVVVAQDYDTLLFDSISINNEKESVLTFVESFYQSSQSDSLKRYFLVPITIAPKATNNEQIMVSSPGEKTLLNYLSLYHDDPGRILGNPMLVTTLLVDRKSNAENEFNKMLNECADPLLRFSLEYYHRQRYKVYRDSHITADAYFYRSRERVGNYFQYILKVFHLPRPLTAEDTSGYTMRTSRRPLFTGGKQYNVATVDLNDYGCPEILVIKYDGKLLITGLVYDPEQTAYHHK